MEELLPILPLPTKERPSVPYGAPTKQLSSPGLSSRSPFKPFVVCNLDTKRYAIPGTKTPAEKLQSIVPPMSSKNGSSVPRIATTKQTHRAGSFPTVVPKAELRSLSTKPMLIPGPNETTREQKSPLTLVISEDQSSPPKKTFIANPLGLVQMLKEDKIIGRCPVPVKSTPFTTANEPATRPSRIPRYRISRSYVGVTATSKVKQVVTSRIAGRVKVPGISVERSAVATKHRPGTPTKIKLTTHVVWSPPPSPGLSSFSSQGWTIVADVDVSQIKTVTTICGDGTCSGIGNAPTSGIAGVPEVSESTSPSPALSSFPTIITSSPSLAKSITGVDGAVNIGNPI